MAEVLTIILDYPRDNGFAFDIEYKGKRYLEHRDNKAGSKFAFDVRKTAERFGGFRWVIARKAFMTAFAVKGDEVEILANAFERQGYIVRLVGAASECMPIANAA